MEEAGPASGGVHLLPGADRGHRGPVFLYPAPGGAEPPHLCGRLERLYRKPPAAAESGGGLSGLGGPGPDQLEQLSAGGAGGTTGQHHQRGDPCDDGDHQHHLHVCDPCAGGGVLHLYAGGEGDPAEPRTEGAAGLSAGPVRRDRERRDPADGDHFHQFRLWAAY